MRLIDADALKNTLNYIYDCAYIESKSKEGIASDIIDEIDNAPTVESNISETYGVAYEQGFRHGKEKYERPQGEWEMNKTSVRGRNYTCNNCHKISRNKFCYCPNCGAYMKKGGMGE